MNLFLSPGGRSARPDLAAMLAASALVLAACGGGDPADSVSSQAPLAAAGEGLRKTALASDDGVSCASRVNNTFDKLLECVTLQGVRSHQAALQAIADVNGGIRVSGSPGYDQSVEYAVKVFGDAGYSVTVQPFQFQTFIYLSLPILEQVSPPPAGPVANSLLSYSGSGDVTAPVTALPAPAADATPGCEASDFAGFPAGNIALISRGACSFAIKATNAYNAGAAAVIIYNNAAGVINGTLGNGFTLDIGVTAVTQEVGVQLAATPGLVGSFLALAAVTAVGVVIGEVLFQFVPSWMVGLAAGIVFIIFGIVTLVRKEEEEEEVVKDKGRWGGFLTAFGFVALMELGDKTQLSVITLSAESGAALMVFVGAALGFLWLVVLEVSLGKVIGEKVPKNYIRIGSGAVFIIFGIIFLAQQFL